MEDTHKRIDDVRKEEKGISITNFSQVAYYGVYDGHGGAQTAEMVVDELHSKIFKSELFDSGDIVAAIHNGFQEMDKYVVEEANKQNSMHGCTCVCSLVLDGVVYFANIGDSEGILVEVENGNVTAKIMTKAHKANEPSEKDRIESMGGHVFFGRVYGSLAVSRSFGDAKYKRPKTSKDFVSWEPYTDVQILSPIHKYMILACDGLFDVMKHNEVAEMTHKLFEEGLDAPSVAKHLVTTAVKDLQTEDNVTVIVVKIEWTDQECGESQTTQNEAPVEDKTPQPDPTINSCISDPEQQPSTHVQTLPQE